MRKNLFISLLLATMWQVFHCYRWQIPLSWVVILRICSRLGAQVKMEQKLNQVDEKGKSLISFACPTHRQRWEAVELFGDGGTAGGHPDSGRVLGRLTAPTSAQQFSESSHQKEKENTRPRLCSITTTKSIKTNLVRKTSISQVNHEAITMMTSFFSLVFIDSSIENNHSRDSSINDLTGLEKNPENGFRGKKETVDCISRRKNNEIGWRGGVGLIAVVSHWCYIR